MVLIPDGVKYGVRRAAERFLAVLDSEAVAPLQAVFYVFFSLGATYLLFFTVDPIEAIEKALGEVVSNVWAALLIGGPVTWLVGRRMHRNLAYVGLWSQLIGDFVTGGALTVYTWAVLDNNKWGDAVFAPFISMPTILCIGLLTFRDVRRIVQVEQQVQADARRRK